FNVFLKSSDEHQVIQKFIQENPPGLITRCVRVSSEPLKHLFFYVGKIDLQMLYNIQSKHPGLSIHNEVVEPSPDQMSSYKALVTEKSQELKDISFTWNQMTSEEYEKQVKQRNECKKFDFIHMIQMLYYVANVAATIKFFRSLLDTNGKLLIIMNSSGWNSLKKTFKSHLPGYDQLLFIPNLLDEMRVKYQCYEFFSDLDITECFMEGNENGELLLEFLTDVKDFSKTRKPEHLILIIHNAKAKLLSPVDDFLYYSNIYRELGFKALLVTLGILIFIQIMFMYYIWTM
uniref:Histamine N-methyltransferase n=1 Tax=Callorhinchus milii TaxID=7868 RepID=A0A4W3HRZ7_CALMI